MMFTQADMRHLRGAVNAGMSMVAICRQFHHHTREHLVEAIDALRRFNVNKDAAEYVNGVLANQRAEIPLINGKPQWRVAANWARNYQPMFND